MTQIILATVLVLLGIVGLFGGKEGSTYRFFGTENVLTKRELILNRVLGVLWLALGLAVLVGFTSL